MLEPWGRAPLVIDGPPPDPLARRDGAEVIRIRRDAATRLPTRLEAGPPSRTAIRAVRPSDADDLLELRVRNRDFLAPWDPLAAGVVLHARGQAEWIALQQRAWADDRGYGFAVLDVEEADRVVGGINLFNIVRSARQSAGMGYWIDEAAGSRGHATAAVRLAVRVRLRASRPAPASSRRSCRATRAPTASWRRRASGARASPSATCGSRAPGRTTRCYALTAEDFAARRDGQRGCAAVGSGRGLPLDPPAASAADAGAARPRARDARSSPPGPASCPLFVEAGLRRPQADRARCPASTASAIDDGRRARPARPPRSASPAVMLFGIPADKDEEGTGAWDDEGIVQLADARDQAGPPRAARRSPTCASASTRATATAGCCAPTARVDNDASLELLARTAVSPRARRRRRRRAERHDGRPRRRASAHALDDEG